MNNPRGLFYFVGAASPQSVRKMLALSEPSKTRPYQAPSRPHMTQCNVSMALPLPGSGLLQQHSPSPSPGLNRRTNPSSNTLGGGGGGGGVCVQPAPAVRTATHERSHSDAAMPVDLNAESSSVTSLANLAAMRKSHMSGSATSSDSGAGSSGTSGGGGGGNGSGSLPQPLGLGLTLGIGLGIGLGADIESGGGGYCGGHNSTDAVSAAGSSTGGVSVHTQLHHHPTGGSTETPPVVAPRTRVPLYPHGTQGMRFPLSVRPSPSFSSVFLFGW